MFSLSSKEGERGKRNGQTLGWIRQSAWGLLSIPFQNLCDRVIDHYSLRLLVHDLEQFGREYEKIVESKQYQEATRCELLSRIISRCFGSARQSDWHTHTIGLGVMMMMMMMRGRGLTGRALHPHKKPVLPESERVCGSGRRRRRCGVSGKQRDGTRERVSRLSESWRVFQIS